MVSTLTEYHVGLRPLWRPAMYHLLCEIKALALHSRAGSSSRISMSLSVNGEQFDDFPNHAELATEHSLSRPVFQYSRT